MLLGTLKIQYNNNAKFEKKVFLQHNKLIFFKGETIDKKVVKKDIVDVRVLKL
jgi:hypothetical protein